MSPQKAPVKGKKETTFFNVLKHDHDAVRDLFERIEEDEEGENREQLFAGLRSTLQEHMDLEEKFFYPVLEQSEDGRDKALEAYEEHNLAKHMLNECGTVDIEDERWNAKFSVLHELVSHHLREEERNTFKMAKNALGKDQVQQITDQIMQQKSAAEKKAA